MTACEVPLDAGEVEHIARSIDRYPAGGGGVDTARRRGPSAVEILVELGQKYQLWHDVLEIGYATVGRLSVRIKSRRFGSLLVREFRQHTGGRIPGAEAVNNALGYLESLALHDGPLDTPCVRVAHREGTVYFHLADSEDRIIEVDGSGWRLCDDPPVRFVKPSGLQPLPLPERSGDMESLRGLLNCRSDDNWALLKAWLVSAASGVGPHPVLGLTGEQGSGKRVTAKLLKSLLDPHGAPLRSEPKEVRDLMIAASHQWIVTIDNVSHLPNWLSDSLCRLAINADFSVQKLYFDNDKTVFQACRPIVLTSIGDFITRGDLLERSLLIQHPSIEKNQRRLEEEILAKFEQLRPKFL